MSTEQMLNIKACEIYFYSYDTCGSSFTFGLKYINANINQFESQPTNSSLLYMSLYLLSVHFHGDDAGCRQKPDAEVNHLYMVTRSKTVPNRE